MRKSRFRGGRSGSGSCGVGGRDRRVWNQTHAGSRLLPKAANGQGLLGMGRGLLTWAVWVVRCPAALREVGTRVGKRTFKFRAEGSDSPQPSFPGSKPLSTQCLHIKSPGVSGTQQRRSHQRCPRLSPQVEGRDG